MNLDSSKNRDFLRVKDRPDGIAAPEKIDLRNGNSVGQVMTIPTAQPKETNRAAIEAKEVRVQLLPSVVEPLTAKKNPFIPEVIQRLIHDYFETQFPGKSMDSYAWVDLSGTTKFKGEPPLEFGKNRVGLFLLVQTGSYYIGEFNHTYKATGQGMLISNDVCYYRGQFLEGTAHGQGEMKEGAILVSGKWENGQLLTGKLAGDDHRYEGSFSGGKPEGLGHLNRGNIYFYEGMFRGGLYHGEGVESNETYIYRGEWENGAKHGTGTIEYADGSKYSGGWLFNQKNGYGTMTLADGQKWTGEWITGKPHKGRWI